MLVPALVVGAALLLLGRPLSVFVSLLPFGMSWRTQAFLSWAGLRGAVPVVLATVPGTVGAPGVTWLFDLVFVLVVIFTVVQAPTLPWVARRLGLATAHHQVDLAVETTPLDELGAELLEIDIGPGSRIAGVRVFELRLPVGANVSLVVREGRSFVPQRQRRAAARRPAARRRPERGARAHRDPAARRQPWRPARRLALTSAPASRVNSRPRRSILVPGPTAGGGTGSAPGSLILG